MSYSTSKTGTELATPSKQETLALARRNVRDLLLRSDAFRALDPSTQQAIAQNTVEVANYLAAPEGIPANKLPPARNVQGSAAPQDAYAFPLAERGGFKAQAAREGAAVAGVLLREVNFPEFVSSLINGVFDSIVTSSIQQMEAYGRLVADVAKSLNQFRDENVSANQGRDHLVDMFPDTFAIDVDTGDFGGEGGPRVRMREGVDERAALQKVNSLPIEGGPLTSLDLEDEETENKLVQAARTQLATSRQQLLATMVMMGINRIVVTDGRISAKVMYDFRAQERYKQSATSFDYEQYGTKTTIDEEREEEEVAADTTTTWNKEEGWRRERRGGTYWSKGAYKETSEPNVKLTSAVAEATEAQLSTRASLAGNVDINFKSETFPLEKLADSFQIGQIQNAAERKGTGQRPPAGGGAPGGGSPPPQNA